MASVEITRTTALFPSAVFVQWNIAADETGTHLVDLYRSGSPEGPWESVAASMADAYNCLDNRFNLPPPPPGGARDGLNLFSLSREVYYQVVVTPPSGPANVFSSPPRPIEPGLDVRTRNLKRKLLRDMAVGFKHLNGIPLIVLKRRHWGTRCPVCVDPVTHESVLEHCTTCFGTGFTGGYWSPVLIRGRRSTAPVQTQMTAHGDSDTKVVAFTILDYPHVEYKDIIVDLQRNDRYQIQMVASTELKSVIVHQVATASLLGRNSIEYSLLVDPTSTPPLY